MNYCNIKNIDLTSKVNIYPWPYVGLRSSNVLADTEPVISHDTAQKLQRKEQSGQDVVIQMDLCVYLNFALWSSRLCKAIIVAWKMEIKVRVRFVNIFLSEKRKDEQWEYRYVDALPVFEKVICFSKYPKYRRAAIVQGVRYATQDNTVFVSKIYVA